MSTDRQFGMVAGPIPYGSIVGWAYAHGIDDPDDIDDLAAVIHTADGMLTEHARKKPQPIGGGTGDPQQQVLPPPKKPTFGGGGGVRRVTGGRISGR